MKGPSDNPAGPASGPVDDGAEGLQTWRDTMVQPAGGCRGRGSELRLPLWLVVFILTVWVSAILVTVAYLVAYAAGIHPTPVPDTAWLSSATPTPSPTSQPSITPTATVRRVVTLYRSPTPPEATPEPSLEPTVEEEVYEEEPEGIAEEAASAEPELPSATPEPTATPSPTPLPNPYEAHLVGVVDGSTIEVEYGGETHRVRFLGVNVPDKDNPDPALAEIGRRAEELTSLLVQGTPLLLEWDVTEADADGTLLRYVWANGRHVGLELVRQGLASVVISESDARYQDVLYAAQLAAQNECLGLWSCD